MDDPTPKSSGFNPYNQTMFIATPDGIMQAVPIEMAFLFQSHLTVQAICHGVQIGMTGVLLLILLIMTRPEKFRSTVFVLNAASLLLVFSRGVLAAMGSTDIFHNFYNAMFQFYPKGPQLRSATTASVAAEIINVFLYITIFASLAFQVHVVCGTLPCARRVSITIPSVLLTLTALAWRIYLSIITIGESIIKVSTVTTQTMSRIAFIASVNNILTVTIIALFTVIFNLKLFFAIVARRRFNLQQFGPMHAIFIMSCQTMVVPLIFAVVTYWVLPNYQLNTFAIPLVAVFLPLSSLWASTGHVEAANRPERRLLHGFPDDQKPGESFYERHFQCPSPASPTSHVSGTSTTSGTSATLVGDYPHAALTTGTTRSASLTISPSSSRHHSSTSTTKLKDLLGQGEARPSEAIDAGCSSSEDIV